MRSGDSIRTAAGICGWIAPEKSTMIPERCDMLRSRTVMPPPFPVLPLKFQAET